MKNKTALVMIAVLAVPLGLYFVPYSYAATTGPTTNVVDGPLSNIAPGAFASVYATCNTGDYVTGGGYSVGVTRDVVVSNSEPVGNGWGVGMTNTGTTTLLGVNAIAVCETPITVAGIGVPEFGQLYIVIALGAVVFFLLARYNAGKSEAKTSMPSTALQ